MSENTSHEHATPTISVIVPIYNAERYLDQALKSIEEQTCRNIEIICINDGSTDGSLNILRDHAESDARIAVIDKLNEGYGAACNQGIATAKGEWVSIVEPDDWIEPAMYDDMLSFAKGLQNLEGSPAFATVDIIKTPYWRIADADTPHERKLDCSYRAAMKGARSPFAIESHPELLMHHPSIWSAIYRRSFLDKNEIGFMPIPGAGWADNPFLIDTLCKAHAIAYLDRPYYCYRAESPEKSRAFYTNSFEIPLARWNEMVDSLDRTGNVHPEVLKALYHRGFLYIGKILECHSIQESDVRSAVEGALSRMHPEIVSEIRSASPALKSLYSSVTGNKVALGKAGYLAHMLRSGIYSIRNIGIKETLSLMKG